VQKPSLSGTNGRKYRFADHMKEERGKQMQQLVLQIGNPSFWRLQLALSGTHHFDEFTK